MPLTFSTFVTIVMHTPLWVWPLYAMLLFLGFQRTRDSDIPLLRMLILPLIVAMLAIVSFIVAGIAATPAMLAGLAIGGAAGWQIEREGATRRLPGGRIWLRGDWWTFALILLVLVFRYVINVVPVLSPALDANAVWHFGTLFVSAGLSGAFLGRTAARLRVYYRGAAGEAAAA